VRFGHSNDRFEELDPSAKWGPLGHAIHNVWRDLQGWIMNHTPPNNDTDWFTLAKGIGADEGTCIEDPEIATKHSSTEQVGFFSTFSLPHASSK
jgi:hypothetical protein